MLIAARKMRRARSKTQVFTAEMVSLRLVSYSEAKAAMYAQEGGNGATGGGRAKDVINNEDGAAAQTSCFNIDLIRASYGR